MGSLFIISSPSGGGKTSLIQELTRRDPLIQRSISYSTRPPRPGEVNGEDYHFISEMRFQQLLSQGAFLEKTSLFGFSYATAKMPIVQAIQTGKDVCLALDWEGAMQVTQSMAGVLIFLLPPNPKVLRERLEKRNTEGIEALNERLRQASSACSKISFYDYLVLNEDFDRAFQDLWGIICANRLRVAQQIASLKSNVESWNDRG